MDVWQPEYTLDIQAGVHARNNSHTTSTNIQTHTLPVGKVTMLFETKGQMADKDTGPELAK